MAGTLYIPPPYPRLPPMPTYAGRSYEEAARDAAVAAMGRVGLTALFVLLVVMASGGFQSLLFIDIYNPTNESQMGRLSWLPIYGLAMVLLVFRLPHVFRLVSFAPLIVVCVLLAGMSMLWSVDPGVTLRRAFALMMSTCIGLALAAWLSWARMIQVIACAFILLAVISFLVVIINPARGIMSEIYPGAWRGMWETKNDLGGFMAKGFLAMLGATAVRPGRLWLWGPGGVLTLALILLTGSKTALLIAMGGLALFMWMMLYRKMALIRPVLWLALVGGTSVIVSALVFFPEPTLALIGKDPTFTGRTDIWSLLIAAVAERPVGGYGYGAFWLDPLGPSYSIRTVLEWGVPSAHNGWFDLWLGVGVVGVVAFALHLLLTLGTAVGRLKSGGREVYWVVLYTLAFVGFSLSESSILVQNDLSWVMFVATSAKLLAGERMPRRGQL